MIAARAQPKLSVASSADDTAKNRLVQSVIKAYEAYGAAQTTR